MALHGTVPSHQKSAFAKGFSVSLGIYACIDSKAVIIAGIYI
jgi:hypothetical protein